jgi:hypothetical protein
MKNIFIALMLFSVNAYAVDAYNGKEYKVRQTLQNLNVTGTATAGYFSGDGSLLTNLPSSGGSPFNMGVSTSNLSMGTYRLTAGAYDIAGATIISKGLGTSNLVIGTGSGGAVASGGN